MTFDTPLRKPSLLRRLYAWTLDKSAHPQAEWWLAVISFVESSFFPIPPHPLLGLMCLSQPQRAIRFAVICTLFSVLGGVFGYAIGYFVYESIGTVILSALGISDNFSQAACYMRQYGAQIILIKGATPIPFKLLTLAAGFVQMNLFTFLWASLVSRGFQFLLVGILFRLFGAPVKAFIEKYLALLSAFFLIALVGGFVVVGVLGESSADEPSDCTLLVQQSPQGGYALELDSGR